MSKDKDKNKDNINEDAYAGASSGMGAVSTPAVATVPGAAYTGNGTTGSGDYGVNIFRPFEKYPQLHNQIISKKKKRKGKKKKNESVLLDFADFILEGQGYDHTYKVDYLKDFFKKDVDKLIGSEETGEYVAFIKDKIIRIENLDNAIENEEKLKFKFSSETEFPNYYIAFER